MVLGARQLWTSSWQDFVRSESIRVKFPQLGASASTPMSGKSVDVTGCALEGCSVAVWRSEGSPRRAESTDVDSNLGLAG